VVLFFQAEDGIRDRNVTGVQTCALPILKRLPVSLLAGLRPPCSPSPFLRRLLNTNKKGSWLCYPITITTFAITEVSPMLVRNLRSEERRVGNVCVVVI